MRKFAILIVWLAACHSTEKKIIVSDNKALIRELLIDEFDLKDYSYVDSTLKYENSPYKVVILHPGRYKLKKIQVYQPLYSPFVIRVSNANDSLIFLFTFADELHYLYNDFHASIKGDEIIKQYPHESWTPPPYKKDLEYNLNALIVKLGYEKNRRATYQLLEVIFEDLLRMQPYGPGEAQYDNAFLSKFKINDPVIKQSIQEYLDFEKNCQGRYCFYANEGGLGYWVFDLEEDDNDNLKVKARFIGDLLYFVSFM